MPRKPNPKSWGRAGAKLRWAKPDADRNQPREAGKLGGRPRDPDRCLCDKHTRRYAVKNALKCAPVVQE